MTKILLTPQKFARLLCRYYQRYEIEMYKGGVITKSMIFV